MIGDLHCHTKLSDGSMGIEELVAYAKRMGLDFLSITDHDTMAGVKRASVLCNRYGISLIPGVELSVIDTSRNRRAHILCYLPDKTVLLDSLCSKIIASRSKAGQKMALEVMKYYPIVIENILKFSQGSLCIYKQHIMCALMEAGYTNEMYGDLFKDLFDSKNGRVYEPVEYPDVETALKIAKASGAIAVLAHPGVYSSFELAEEMAEKKLISGIELNHPKNTAEDKKRILELCDKYNLITTGGTDFHGMFAKRPNPIATCMATDEQISALFALKSKK